MVNFFLTKSNNFIIADKLIAAFNNDFMMKLHKE